MGRLANIAKCPEIDWLKHSVQGMMKTREQRRLGRFIGSKRQLIREELRP
jgi:hypothetical protein